MNYANYSSKIKKEADQILNEYQIIDNLARIGDVEIVGSYKFDLMWQRDIDIYIKNPKYPKFSKLIEIMNNCFPKKDFYYFKFEDNTELIKPNLPKGVGLFIKLNSGWKFDLWFLKKKEADRKESLISELFNDYRREMKEDILKYKSISIEQGVYNKKFTSYDLYQAIINNDIDRITKHLK